jgi:MATE family multidrug resistance protein
VGLGVAFMATSAAVMLLGWRLILGVFQLDAEVTALAHRLLLVAGFFQLFDGAQVTLAGVLRGVGDTVSSLVANLVGHWVIGLPVGCALAFGLGWGAVGLWVGLATGLAATAAGLVWRWGERSRRVTAGHPAGHPAGATST